MTRVTVTLDLPNDLAKEAQANGLLRENSLVGMIRAEVQRRKSNELFDRYSARLARDTSEPMSLQDIQAEVRAVRKARRH